MPVSAATFAKPPAPTIALRSHSMPVLSATNSYAVKRSLSGRIVATSDSVSGIDSRMADDDTDLFIDDTLDAMLARSGVTSQELADRSGVGYSHIRNLAQGQKPLTMKIALRLSRALGLTLAQFLGQAADRPTTVGVLALQGELMSETHTATVLGHYLVTEPFAGLAESGSIVQIHESPDWIAGRHLAIRYSDGRVRIRLAEEADGLRYLRDDLGDLIRFDAARHAVIGRVTRVIRELEG